MRNEGTIDRAIRVLAGLALLALAWSTLGLTRGDVSGIIVTVVGVILLLTGLVGFCPAYRLVGIRTCSVPK